MGYSKNDILKKCQIAFDDIKTFYKQPFINYNGRTYDTNEYYTEVVAEFLCRNIFTYIDGIPKITREVSYKTVGHDGVFDVDTPREEEKIAMEMFNQSKSEIPYDFIGNIIDYQTPLKNKRSDVAGKIDLLSYDGKTLYILELKKPDSDESMLRCVLEGYTYLSTVNHKKILADFEIPENTNVAASPLVFLNSSQYREMQEERPHLKHLMYLLKSKAFYVIKKNDKYFVEE